MVDWRQVALAATIMLGACASNGTAPDILASGPQSSQPALAAGTVQLREKLDPDTLTSRLGTFEEGRWTLRMAGAPVCGVDVYRYEYRTVGARGEAATASAGLMIPTGADPRCRQPNAIVTALHGTMPDRGYDLSDVSGKNPASARAVAWAGVYASQGYIVVAPNYIGLDTSSTDYQSYHDARQQAQDVIDAIAAGREVLAGLGTQASDKLFLAGYSQGGWVTMATHREMEARGMAVTASVPMSGVYALSALVDDVFMGRPVRGSTLYFPLAIRAYQEAYGDIYGDPGEVYAARLAADVATLLPSTTPHHQLIASGRLPASNVFNPTRETSGLSEFVAGTIRNSSPASDPGQFAAIYATGFGPDPLFADEFRIRYLQDIEAHPDGAHPQFLSGDPPSSSDVGLRRAAIRNDLRGWVPKNRMMMCGGAGDGASPLRFGGQLMMRYWSDPERSPRPGVVTLLDFEEQAGAADPYSRLRRDFHEQRQAIEEAVAWPAWVDPYHQVVLPRYCYLAARDLFDTMR